MASTENQSEAFQIDEEDKECLMAVQLATGSIVQLVFKAAIELNLLDIMANAGPEKQLSAIEIAALLPTKNPDAPDMLDRIMCLLASYSILTYSQVTGDNGRVQRVYGLGSICQYFVSNEDGISMSPLLLLIHHKAYMEGCHHLKEAVLEGGTSFKKAHGMQIFEYLGMDPKFNEVFNKTMVNLSITLLKGVLEIYDGFAKANVVVDVGGGLGENIALITSTYPKINGINFDLPHVIAVAPAYPGVEHVAGDMFLSVPKADMIFMKMILHNWGDDHCLKLLKNCYETLPEDGKVVVVEAILPETPETNLLAKCAFRSDLLMMTQHIGGKERTEMEYKSLAKSAGFNGYTFVSRVFAHCVMEFRKNM